jgi:Uma2 family endonuclease
MTWETRAHPTTVEEYLRWDEGNTIKHEYVGGYVYAMSGATTRHNRITLNLAMALRDVAGRRGCQVFASDVKLRVSGDCCYYPDVMLACGKAAAVDSVVAEPTLVGEVTSPATRRVDNREKLDAYLRIPSLRAYLIADQRRRHVAVASRLPDGGCVRAEYSSGEIPLDFLGHAIAIDEIYDGIELPPIAVGEDGGDFWSDDDEVY